MLKRVTVSILVFLLIAALAVTVISYSRGYRFNFQEKSVTSTGILSASSYPEKASIMVDNRLVAATNASFALPPGWYNVKIQKEGYQSWEKRLLIQTEVVSVADSLLLPTNPSLRALTTTGIHSPSLSPTNTKVAFVVLPEEATGGANLKPKTGIWTLELRAGTLGGRLEPKPVFQPDLALDWKNAVILWSPDEKQLIVTINKTEKGKTQTVQAFLVSLENPGEPFTNVTFSLNDIFREWEINRQEKENTALIALPAILSKFLTANTSQIHFAPDETKIFYLATQSASLARVITPPLIGSNPTQETRTVTPGQYYVYDIKEDKNFSIADSAKFPPKAILWYADSKHLILVEKNTISLVDFDNTNKRLAYAGPFVDSIVYPWASGGKLIILANFNNPQSTPNFYEVNLR